MTTRTQTSSPLLQNALRGNSVFSAISGLSIALAAASLIEFMAQAT